MPYAGHIAHRDDADGWIVYSHGYGDPDTARSSFWEVLEEQLGQWIASLGNDDNENPRRSKGRFENALTRDWFSLVDVEPGPDNAFEGYTDGSLWNGYEKPLFTRRQIQLLVENFPRLDLGDAYMDGDVAVFVHEGMIDVPEEYVPDDEGLYDLSGWAWERTPQ